MKVIQISKDGEQVCRHLRAARRSKLNSDGDFFYKENYLKIDNTNVTAREAAVRIAEAFGPAGPAGGGCT